MKYITLALALMTTTALAQIVPPPQYDRPYHGQLTVERVGSIAELFRLCPNGVKQPIGCAFPNGNSCRIYLVPDSVIRAANSTLARIMRHEIAHCNGWKH